MSLKPKPNTILSPFLILLSLVSTGGCGGKSSNSVPPPQNREFLYVGNETTISVVQIDSSGKLQELPSSPFTAPNDAAPVIADPQSRFLILGAYPSLFPAAIESSHLLSFASNTKFAMGYPLIDPRGRFFFDAADLGGKFTSSTPIHVYSIGANLSFPEVPGSPFEPGILPAVTDPEGKFIFGFGVDAAQNVNAIVTIQIADTGTLTTVNTLPVAFNADYTDVFGHVHPSGQFLYVTNYSVQNYQYALTVYKIGATGTLAKTAFEPNFGLAGLGFVGFNPAGTFVYAQHCSSAACSLDTLSVDQSTGAINTTPLFSLPGWWNLKGFDRSGARLFAVTPESECNLGVSDVLTVFDVSMTGQLHPTSTLKFGSCPPSGLLVVQ